MFVKNLVVRDKKAGLFLVAVRHDAKVDMKALPGLVGASGANFRMADATLMTDKLGVAQGSVSPLAVMNDAAGEVKLVLDKTLVADDATVALHPCDNTATCAISAADLLAFVRKYAHEPILVDLTSAPISNGGAKPPPKDPKPPPPKNEGKKENTDTKGIEYTKAGNFPKWYEQVRLSIGGMLLSSDVCGWPSCSFLAGCWAV